MQCPLKDTTLCRFRSSVELVAGRGVLQHNCSTCGSGCAETVSREVAEALLAELTAHRPPADISPDSSSVP